MILLLFTKPLATSLLLYSLYYQWWNVNVGQHAVMCPMNHHAIYIAINRTTMMGYSLEYYPGYNQPADVYFVTWLGTNNRWKVPSASLPHVLCCYCFSWLYSFPLFRQLHKNWASLWLGFCVDAQFILFNPSIFQFSLFYIWINIWTSKGIRATK